MGRVIGLYAKSRSRFRWKMPKPDTSTEKPQLFTLITKLGRRWTEDERQALCQNLSARGHSLRAYCRKRDVVTIALPGRFVDRRIPRRILGTEEFVIKIVRGARDKRAPLGLRRILLREGYS